MPDPAVPAALVAVLAGGRGSRIGGAKATAPLAGTPLIEHVLAATRQAGLQAVVVAKRDSELPALAEQVLEEPDEPRHPLCGILTALDFASACERAVLAVPCDMPFLSAELLGWLAGLEGAVVLELGGRSQPLPSRCMPGDRAALRLALAHERPLREALGGVAQRVVAERELARFGDPARLCFGVNGREELAAAEAWLATGSRRD